MLGLGLLCATGVTAQIKGDVGKARSATSVDKPRGDAELTSLLSLQQGAVASGDTGQIEASSRALNAYALREYARLRAVEGDGQETHAPSFATAATAVTPKKNGGAAKGSTQAAKTRAMPAAERERLANTLAELRGILASSYNDLGTAEARQQQFGAALADFQKAAEWQPDNATVLRNVGVAAFRTQDYAAAAPALETYLRGAPQDGRSRVMLAMSDFSMGQFEPAAKNFALAPELAMHDPRAAYSWAFSLARTGQQQHANEIAAKLMTAGLPPEALDLVCHVYLDTEAYEQSLRCFRQVTAADASIKLAHYGAGESLIRLDRPAEAIPELRQELVLSPGNANVEASLAFALLQTSDKAEARGLLESAVASEPDNARAQYQLGKLLLDGGDLTGALPHLETAERSDPTPDYVHYQLQVAYRKLGRVADADREMGLYREIKARARAAATVPGR